MAMKEDQFNNYILGIIAIELGSEIAIGRQVTLAGKVCEAFSKETNQQLTEANALIEKMRLKLIEANETIKELSSDHDDVLSQQYIYTSRLINEVNEYKTKQTTQEVKL